MTGPEHYVEAERLASLATRGVDGDHIQMQCSAAYSALAQVHATLAQVVATMELVGATVNGVVTAGWSEAIS